jgi:thiol-disulfide isomerase/thioredoxin
MRRWFRYAAVLILGALLAITSLPAFAQDKVDVYFFHSHTCPHCREQMPLMEAINDYNDDVTVHIIEVNEEPAVWQEFRDQHGVSSGAVPRTQVGDLSFIGYSATDGDLEYVAPHDGYIGYRNQIVDAITELVGHPLQLTADATTPAVTAEAPWRFPWLVLGLPILYVGSYPLFKGRLQSLEARRFWFGGLATVNIVALFLLVTLTPDAMIKSFAQALPFPLFVSVVALADGFNPCAFTVLIILLSLLTHTRRRRDMAIVGGTFVATSAVMYFLFIMVMIGLGAVLLEQFGTLFLLILGSVIAIAGLINLKDYFWFKQGVSLSLSQQEQRTITQRAGRIVRKLGEAGNDRIKFFAAIGSTVLLAVFVNVVELGCTAILPAVYMTTLVNYCSTQPIGGLPCYSLWTAFYAVLYVVPLALILLNFIYSFKSARLTETQGRRLKLVAGLFMVFFGLVMIFQPNLLVFG